MPAVDRRSRGVSFAGMVGITAVMGLLVIAGLLALCWVLFGSIAVWFFSGF